MGAPEPPRHKSVPLVLGGYRGKGLEGHSLRGTRQADMGGLVSSVYPGMMPAYQPAMMPAPMMPREARPARDRGGTGDSGLGHSLTHQPHRPPRACLPYSHDDAPAAASAAVSKPELTGADAAAAAGLHQPAGHDPGKWGTPQNLQGRLDRLLSLTFHILSRPSK